MQYQVTMTNFGNVVYQGTDLAQAQAQAVKTGFECTVICTDERGRVRYKAWSPIGGWR